MYNDPISFKCSYKKPLEISLCKINVCVLSKLTKNSADLVILLLIYIRVILCLQGLSEILACRKINWSGTMDELHSLQGFFGYITTHYLQCYMYYTCVIHV